MRRAIPVALPISHSSGLRWKKRDQRVARTVTDAMKPSGIQLRTLAYFGLLSSAGAAPNRMLAAMTCGLTPPGRRTVIDDSRIHRDAVITD